MTPLRHAALALACAAGGAAVSLATLLVHGTGWGLALGAAASVATMAALPAAWWGRFAFSVGFVLLLGVLTPVRPEGDFLVATDLVGYLLLGFGIAVLAVGFAGLLRGGRPAPRPPGGATDDSGGVEPAP